MAGKRRRFTAEEKISILRRSLLDKVAVSELCEEYELRPTVFYSWQKLFFENGARALAPEKGGREKLLEARLNELAEKLARKNEVLSELLEENLLLKQQVGSRK